MAAPAVAGDEAVGEAGGEAGGGAVSGSGGGWGGWVRVGIGVWAAAATLLLFAAAMTQAVTYDEDQYVAAGVLARHLMPYRDFAYLQSPLYPFVLAAVFRLADGWFLLAARLLTFVLAVGSGLVLWRLVRRLGSGVGVSMVLVTACLVSPYLVSPLANARNDALPLFLLLAGLLLHLWAVERSWWGRAGAALLFGLAVEAKVSYVFGPVVLGVWALGAPGRRVPPYVLGMAVAAVPAAACWWMAPEGFRFGVLDYHLAAPGAWYGQQGLGATLGLWTRVQQAADWGTFGGNLTLVVLCVALSLLAMARHRKWKRPGALLLGLTVGAAVLGLAPAPSWPVYFAAVPPLLACCAAHLDRTTAVLAGAARRRVLMVVAALPIVPSVLVEAPEVGRLFDQGNWVGVAAHENAVAVRALVPGGGAVATLYPIWVADANAVLPGLAAGPFVFRSGGLFAAGTLGAVHAVTSTTVEAAFGGAAVGGAALGAIYAGLYGGAWRVPMDAALTSYAEGHGWHVARTDAMGGRLWVPP